MPKVAEKSTAKKEVLSDKQQIELWDKDAESVGGWTDAYPRLSDFPIGPTQNNKYD